MGANATIVAKPSICMFFTIRSNHVQGSVLTSILWFPENRGVHRPREGDDTSKALNITDVQLGRGIPETLLLQIRFSKTDQYGKSTTLRINANRVEGVCPVQAMKSYLQARPQVEGLLFGHENGSPLQGTSSVQS